VFNDSMVSLFILKYFYDPTLVDSISSVLSLILLHTTVRIHLNSYVTTYQQRIKMETW